MNLNSSDINEIDRLIENSVLVKYDLGIVFIKLLIIDGYGLIGR